MILMQILSSVFPLVKKQLKDYEGRLLETGGALAEQGLNSIRDKKFHCLGGGAYALLAPRCIRPPVLTFIVAFQTISDYLDNLCDRFGLRDEGAFRQLHGAMLEALAPEVKEKSDYYRLFPRREDGGYLNSLVDQCRQALSELPHYTACRDYCRRFTQVYIDLQSYKHLERKRGEEKLKEVHARSPYPGLCWWEYAAACGSTLGIFSLVAGSEPCLTWEAYMPWLNGLHIMLDYFIDQAEDLEHGDMNLMAYYNAQVQIQRLLHFYRRSRQAVQPLARRKFHALVTDGLLALYLSDKKALAPQLLAARRQILNQAHRRTWVLAQLAAFLRQVGAL